MVIYLRLKSGRRRITADTVLRLSNYFGNSAKYWLDLEDDFGLEEALSEKNELSKSIKKYNIHTD